MDLLDRLKYQIHLEAMSTEELIEEFNSCKINRFVSMFEQDQIDNLDRPIFYISNNQLSVTTKRREMIKKILKKRGW